MPLHPRSRSIGLLFWILTLITLPIWAVADHAGWDVVFYRNAVVAMRAGHDPYVDAMAAQEAFHRDLALHPNATPPYSYVYSPLTLPPLRLVGRLPGRLTYIAYAILSAISAFALVWVGFRTGEAADRPFLNLVTPVAVFFPGLLAHDTVLSGNVAFLLYALVLLGAAYGWMRGKYLWCYVAIIVASCFKAPLLSLVVVPLFSARKQWPPVHPYHRHWSVALRYAATGVALAIPSFPAGRRTTVQLQPRLRLQPRGYTQQCPRGIWNLVFPTQRDLLPRICVPSICDPPLSLQAIFSREVFDHSLGSRPACGCASPQSATHGVRRRTTRPSDGPDRLALRKTFRFNTHRGHHLFLLLCLRQPPRNQSERRMETNRMFPAGELLCSRLPGTCFRSVAPRPFPPNRSKSQPGTCCRSLPAHQKIDGRLSVSAWHPAVTKVLHTPQPSPSIVIHRRRAAQHYKDQTPR